MGRGSLAERQRLGHACLSQASHPPGPGSSPQERAIRLHRVRPPSPLYSTVVSAAPKQPSPRPALQFPSPHGCDSATCAGGVLDAEATFNIPPCPLPLGQGAPRCRHAASARGSSTWPDARGGVGRAAWERDEGFPDRQGGYYAQASVAASIRGQLELVRRGDDCPEGPRFSSGARTCCPCAGTADQRASDPELFPETGSSWH